MKFLGCPEYENNHNNLLRKMINVVKGIMQGKTNNTESITLTANSTTTTVTLAEGRIGLYTYINFMPLTSNAAVELASGNMYVSSRNVASNQFVITHTNNAQINRSFYYVLIG